MSRFGVVDIFAGPGGLAEGFSKVIGPDGKRAFRIEQSVEKDPIAHATLQLRSFLRQFDTYPDAYYRFLNEGGDEPDWSTIYPSEWARACEEAMQLELGKEDPNLRLNPALDRIRAEYGDRTILIGGPPCQAYSIVGRARNQGKEGYIASEDDRHYLYQEYIRILDRLRPAAFIMENVKGLLSSSVDGENRIVDRVLADLRGERKGAAPYRLIALAPGRTRVSRNSELRPSDFVIRAEEFGIPRARHRLIIVGLREDLAQRLSAEELQQLLAGHAATATVRQVLEGMPTLRSGLSRNDDADRWKSAVVEAIDEVIDLDLSLSEAELVRFRASAAQIVAGIRSANSTPERDGGSPGISPNCPEVLRDWLVDDRLTMLPNNDTRGHMERDLARYFFASLFSEVTGRSPKARDYAPELAPKHRNWRSGKFADRFRVQVWDRPARTVTSHISKDGHYFIHPDPAQCRSLTVREAARLQTFPDNYFFKGRRTDQYVQVGNAVPPLLAHHIGEALLSLLSGAGLWSDAELELANVA